MALFESIHTFFRERMDNFSYLTEKINWHLFSQYLAHLAITAAVLLSNRADGLCRCKLVGSPLKRLLMRWPLGCSLMPRANPSCQQGWGV